MNRKPTALVDAGCAPYLFLVPMLLLTAALSFGAIVLIAREAPTEPQQAQQQKCPPQGSPCPMS